MPPRLLIGLLAGALAPFSSYEKAAFQLGINLLVFTSSGVNWQRRRIRGLIWDGTSWSPGHSSFPFAVYNRLYSGRRPIVARLSQAIGPDAVFNQVNKLDKWRVYEVLRTPLADHLPQTWLFHPNRLHKLLTQYGSLIIKPRWGRMGSRIMRVERNGGYALFHKTKYPVLSSLDTEQMKRTIAKRTAKGDFIVQRFIPFRTAANRHFDVRILVQKDATRQWVAAANLSRLAHKQFYVTNFIHSIQRAQTALQQAELDGPRLLAKLETLAIRTAQALEEQIGTFGEMSVDFGIDSKEHPWIIEVNGKPDKTLFRQVGDTSQLDQVYRNPLAYGLSFAQA